DASVVAARVLHDGGEGSLVVARRGRGRGARGARGVRRAAESSGARVDRRRPCPAEHGTGSGCRPRAHASSRRAHVRAGGAAPDGGEPDVGGAVRRVFGGFAGWCFAAYGEAYQLESGWEGRVALHQIAPLVVHAIKFGGGYVGSATAVIAQYK